MSNLTAYTNADWVGCPDTRKSTFSYCVFLGANLVSWCSKWHNTVSHFSAKAEYRFVANVVIETCWLRQILYGLHQLLTKATVIYCDNMPTVYLSSNMPTG